MSIVTETPVNRLRMEDYSGQAEPGLRVPPHSAEAEQSVLGGLLLDNGAWEHVGALRDVDFYRHEHALIYAAIGTLLRASEPADVITVFQQLQSLGESDECGGLGYLNSLAQSVPSAANMRRYVEIVREQAVLRKLVAASDEIATAAFNPQGRAVSEILDEAAAKVVDIRSSSEVSLAPRARALDFASLSGHTPPPRYWRRAGWLGSGFTLVPGLGGSGKSGLIQHEATTGAIGRAYFAPAAEPYRSLLWNCEDDHDELWRRQYAICEHEQVGMADLAENLRIVSRYGCDNALMAEVQRTLVTTRLLEELRQQVNDERIDVLWLDNVAHIFLGAHDDRTQVTMFINVLNGLVRDRPFAVIGVAHVSRAQGSEFSGSVAWENAARMRWYLGARLPDQRVDEGSDEPVSDVRYLCRRKSNYSALDHVRMTMREGLLVPDQVAQSRVGGLVSAMDERRAEEICLAGFRSLCVMGIRTTDGKTTGDYLPSQIVAKGLAYGYSKSDLGKAMNRLMTRGEFIRGVIGKHTNRSDKFGLILKEGAA